MSGAGFGEVSVQLVPGTARFPSIRSRMECDVRGWTLADHIDDAQFEQLATEAEKELTHLLTPDGEVQFAHPALIATAVSSAKAPA